MPLRLDGRELAGAPIMLAPSTQREVAPLPLPTVHPHESLRRMFAFGALRKLYKAASGISGTPHSLAMIRLSARKSAPMMSSSRTRSTTPTRQNLTTFAQHFCSNGRSCSTPPFFRPSIIRSAKSRTTSMAGKSSFDAFCALPATEGKTAFTVSSVQRFAIVLTACSVRSANFASKAGT